MPDAISTIAGLITIFNFITAVNEGEVDVYLNGNKVSEIEHVQPQEVNDPFVEGELRRQQILLAALERKEIILSQTTLR